MKIRLSSPTLQSNLNRILNVIEVLYTWTFILENKT